MQSVTMIPNFYLQMEQWNKLSIYHGCIHFRYDIFMELWQQIAFQTVDHGEHNKIKIYSIFFNKKLGRP